MGRLLLGTLIGIGVLIPSILGSAAYLKYSQVQELETAKASQEAVRIKEEKDQIEQLKFDRKTLLAEYDRCCTEADIDYHNSWIRTCNDQPWEKREDGICHLLPAHQVDSMARWLTEEKNRCQDTYRNKMMALGIRQ